MKDHTIRLILLVVAWIVGVVALIVAFALELPGEATAGLAGFLALATPAVIDALFVKRRDRAHLPKSDTEDA